MSGARGGARGGMEGAEAIEILELDAAAAAARLDALADILVDAVANGASVNFMAGLTRAEARAFWTGQIPGLADGSRRLLVAVCGGALVGTAILTCAPQPNAPHRAEVGKMLVHSSMRRRGLGRRLLSAVEALGAGMGRTLLVLDTESGSAGERLYRSCGWTAVGSIPGHSHRPDGPLAAATIFYKSVSAVPTG